MNKDIFRRRLSCYKMKAPSLKRRSNLSSESFGPGKALAFELWFALLQRQLSRICLVLVSYKWWKSQLGNVRGRRQW